MKKQIKMMALLVVLSVAAVGCQKETIVMHARLRCRASPFQRGTAKPGGMKKMPTEHTPALRQTFTGCLLPSQEGTTAGV